jgi:ATP-dependent DNA helicase RecG
MTTDELKQIIASGETMTVEFKGESGKRLSYREMYESVVCLANA